MTPTTRNNIPLTEDEITIEIHNYQRQIDAMKFEISILKKELRYRFKVKNQITAGKGKSLIDVLE